mgnify:CR=1 FL=1
MMHKLQKMPDILKDFDRTLTARERGRLVKHSDKYSDILALLSVRNTEREAQIFLYYELLRPEPRFSLVERLCGMLLRMESRRIRTELIRFYKLQARKRY